MSPVNVLCLYQDGTLPAAWFQVVRRLRHQVERAGLDARIRLVRLGAVPSDAAFVVAPAGLADRARALAARAEVLAVPAGGAEKVLGELVERLRREASATGAEPRRSASSVVRRGFEVVEWRTP